MISEDIDPFDIVKDKYILYALIPDDVTRTYEMFEVIPYIDADRLWIWKRTVTDDKVREIDDVIFYDDKSDIEMGLMRANKITETERCVWNILEVEYVIHTNEIRDVKIYSHMSRESAIEHLHRMYVVDNANTSLLISDYDDTGYEYTYTEGFKRYGRKFSIVKSKLCG